MASTIGPVEVVASAARTTTGQTGALQPGGKIISVNREHLNLLVDVTANDGTTPTLDLSVEWSMDGGSTWAVGDTADAFTQIGDTTTTVVEQFQLKAPHYRIKWTLGGTSPSYTFSIREYLT